MTDTAAVVVAPHITIGQLVPRRPARRYRAGVLERIEGLAPLPGNDPDIPWEPLTLAGCLDAVDMCLRQFVHFSSEEQSWAVALWVAHTYAIESIDVSPRLAIRAATRQAGKTRLLEVLAQLCKDSWLMFGPSEAAMFRKIDKDHPTILLDEADRLFEKRSEDVSGIVGVINAGHGRGGTVPRVVMTGNKGTVMDFPVFGALALAGIANTWSDTVMDRSIVIHLERRAKGELVSKFRRSAHWSPDAIGDELGQFLDAAVTGPLVVKHMPDVLQDRQQDNWEPLVAIALLAGAHWPERAMQAAMVLSKAGAITAEDDRIELLALRDVAAVFETMPHVDKLATTTIIAVMTSNAEAPWSEEPHPLNAHRLGKHMRVFGVKSEIIERGVRGYQRAHVERAWHRLRTADAPVVEPEVNDQSEHG